MSEDDAAAVSGKRARWLGYALIALAIVVVLGPFVWILANSFKTQIAILTGAWLFTPTLDNYADVLFSRRSDFVRALGTSFVVAAASTIVVVVVGTLAAYSLHRFRWSRIVVTAVLVAFALVLPRLRRGGASA